MSNKKRAYRFIAITGGMGSGKSAIGAELRKRGYSVLDADQIAREVVAPGEPALAEIAEAFGTRILHEDGSLNRPALRQLMTENERNRLLLEGILHPRIREKSLADADKIHAETGEKVIFYEVPLLFESGRDHDFDKVICVTADDNIRIERIQNRSGMQPQEIKKIFGAQMDQRKKIVLSDFHINNNGQLVELLAQIDEVLDQIKI